MKQYKPIRNFVRRLRRDQRGAVTLTFLATATLMLGGAFGAIDLVRYNVAQGRLQNALDAAVISAGRNLDTQTPVEGSDDREAWMSHARGFFSSNMPDGYMGSSVSSDDVVIGYREQRPDGYLTGQFIDMSVEGNLPLISTGFMKISSVGLAASNAAVRRTRNDMEVVMALDNSGSMDWDSPKKRIDVLKEAAKDLTSTVLGASNVPGGSQRVYIGLVPFTDVVNVRDYALDGGWLDYPPEQFNYIHNPNGWSGCIAEPAPAGGANWTSSNRLPADVLSPAAAFRPLHLTYSYTYSPLPPGAVLVGENPIAFSSRTLSRDRRISAVQTGNSFRINVAMNPEYCLEGKARFLSNDERAISQAIDAMVAYGGTGVPVGLQWAWRMLHPNWQGAWGEAGMPRDPEEGSLNKVIVLLSDGENAPVSDGRRRTTSNTRFDFDLTYRYKHTWTENGACIRYVLWWCVEYEQIERSEERVVTTSDDQSPSRFYQCPAAGLRVLDPLVATSSDVDRSTGACNHARNSIGYGGSNRQDEAAYDAYMEQLCHNVKNDGNDIKLYTVTLGKDVPASARTLMRNCASGPSYYFNAQNVDDLPAVFASIAGALTELRLTE